ncbi:MAG: pseudouridine synthase [Pseudomonadales bacterium]|nr:pseudouridine synthase [Pseudomonadales bacterium]
MYTSPLPSNQIILLNKPYQVLSQYSEHEGKITLARYIKHPNIYPAGRLDYDSEGLLLLTGNGPLQHRLTDPKHKLAKTYWAQVEGEVSEQALQDLSKGVELKDGMTRPAKARRIEPPPIWERNPPIRFRANIPTSWVELTIHEGRNRQVRRMTAAVGYPTLRLIRQSIGPWSLDSLQPGESRIETVPAALLPKQEKNKPRTQRGRHQRSRAR